MSASTDLHRGASTAAATAGIATGTRVLVALILRRDRVWLSAWILLTLGVVTSRASTTDTIYPDVAARQDRYRDVMHDVPMFKLFQGPAYADTVPALVAQETVAAATLVAALGAVLLLVRHTRGEEQSGRRELVGSTAVGRHAQLTAALTVVLGAGAGLALLSAASLVALGMPGAGSAALGLVVGGAVWIAAATAAVTAQLTETARAASVTAFALFAGMHFVRGVFDMGDGALRTLGWLVPNGWLQRSRPYADEQWWTFLLVLVLVVALVRIAYTLADRRDLGAGLLAARPGPSRAARNLSSSMALTWRLHRPTAVTVALASAAIALPTGFVGADAMEAYATSERMQIWADAMGAATAGEAFFAYIAFATCFPTTMYAIATVLRLRREEEAGHAELLLSNPVGRTRWAAGHLAVALVVPVGLQLILGLCFGLGSGQLGAMLTTTLGLVPAVWVMVGIAIAAYGLLRRGAAIVAWGALIVAVLVELGQHLGWPAWTFQTFSPFAHVLPFLGPPSTATLLTLTLIAAILTGLGLAGVRHRDLIG